MVRIPQAYLPFFSSLWPEDVRAAEENPIHAITQDGGNCLGTLLSCADRMENNIHYFV